MTDAVWQWYGGEGDNPDTYSVGPLSTREEVLKECQVGYAWETFTILEATKATMEQVVPDFNQLWEIMSEQADSDCLFGDDYGELTGSEADQQAAADDYATVIHAWYERHRAIFPTPWAFGQTRNVEVFKPVEEPAPE